MRRRRDMRSFFGGGQVLRFDWQFALGGTPLDQEELDRLAEAHRPIVRLRDQWVIVDPEVARKARAGRDRELPAIDALSAALTGTAEVDGERVEVTSTRWLDELRRRIAEPDAGREPVAQPAALAATLRDYQLRGLAWLDRMTSLGLGGCLADDMGLGKTITLIALHLHRQVDPATAGPTLVVCPASLLGNWQREINRFAPGTPVHRFHGPVRNLTAQFDGVRPHHVRDDAPGQPHAADAALGHARRGRGAARQELATRATARELRTHPGGRARRADRHAGREQPLRTVGAPRLDDPRPARHADVVPLGLRQAVEADGDDAGGGAAGAAGRGRSCCAAASPTRASPRSCRRRRRPTSRCR